MIYQDIVSILSFDGEDVSTWSGDSVIFSAPLAQVGGEFREQKTAQGVKIRNNEIQKLILHDKTKLFSTSPDVDVY